MRYDLLFLFAYALAFAGAYLLGARARARAGGSRGRGGGVRVRAASAWSRTATCRSSPAAASRWRFALGLRGYRLRRPGWVVAGWAVAAWQLSLGFSLGLPLAYLLATLGLIAAVVWLRRGRPRLDRGLAIATLAGAAIFVAAGAPAQPALRARGRRAPDVARTPADVERVLRPAEDLPRRSRREPGLGRRHGAASGRARERPREDAVPGPRHPRPRRSPGFPRRVFPRGLRRGLGVGVVGGLRPRARLPGRGRLAVALSGRLRAAARRGRRSGFRAGSSPSPRWGLRCSPGRARSGRCWAARRARLSGLAAAAPRSPPSLVAGDRDRGTGASLRPVRQPGPAQGPAGAALRPHRSPRRSSTCRPSEPTTTAATCCGRPTASRRSSTGARASNPAVHGAA